jgi:hypothetical protein
MKQFSIEEVVFSIVILGYGYLAARFTSLTRILPADWVHTTTKASQNIVCYG